MTLKKNSFVKLEEITLINTKATIFQKNSDDDFEAGLIFSEPTNKALTIIQTEEIEFFFVKLMSLNVSKLLNKNCKLLSKSIKFSDDIESNKFLICNSEIMKTTTNLVFTKTNLFQNEKKIIAFSNSIWKIC
ncbi:MAG: hypothetical protein CMM18_02945 [Rhodospirillaceae bacterium]|nr:hypothetical protein [Rhodospirillaceae bacterium]